MVNDVVHPHLRLPAGEARRYVTRSKTGSLTPKMFTDSVTSTTQSLKASVRAASSSSDEVLVINKDGDITRVTRSKTSLNVTQSQYFKLGMGNFIL